MGIRSKYLILLAGTMLASAPAYADARHEAELEARLKLLESAVADLRSELAATRADAQAARDAAVTNAAATQASGEKVAALEASWAKQPKPEDGFKVGGTTIKLNGYFKAVAGISQYNHAPPAAATFIRDFYIPSQIPVTGVGEGRDFEANAKQTRMWLTTATPIGKHMLKGHLEFDFQAAPGSQGNQRTTNAYNLAMRRAFITYDSLLVGQEWSNFQYTGALPESTDYVGPTEGTVFVRQAQVRYTHKLSKVATLSVAVENAETAAVTPVAEAIADAGDDRMPDVTARLLFNPSFGEFSLAGVLRQVSVHTPAASADATGWGLSFAGKIPFGPDKRHDLRFMITHGEGIGRYVGISFSPDVIYTAATNRMQTPQLTAGLAALRLGWTPQLRSTFMGGFQKVDYPASAPPGANKEAWSAAANLFYSPVKPLDFGIEYRHAERTLVSGASGELDRLEFAAKYSF